MSNDLWNTLKDHLDNEELIVRYRNAGRIAEEAYEDDEEVERGYDLDVYYERSEVDGISEGWYRETWLTYNDGETWECVESNAL